MKASLRDLKRLLAKALRPKPESKPSAVRGLGFTQRRGQPFHPKGRRGR